MRPIDVAEFDTKTRRGTIQEVLMKATDVRVMTVDELQDKLVGLKKEQFNLRFQAATGQMENTARVRQVRRDIARVKTIMREKSATATG